MASFSQIQLKSIVSFLFWFLCVSLLSLCIGYIDKNGLDFIDDPLASLPHKTATFNTQDSCGVCAYSKGKRELCVYVCVCVAQCCPFVTLG